MLITYLILKYLFNLQDPYEKIHVYVAPSTISDLAGEGLFAKKVIKKGQLICLFNGVRRRKEGRIRTVIGVNSDEWSDYRLILGIYNQPQIRSYFPILKQNWDSQGFFLYNSCKRFLNSMRQLKKFH